MVVERCQNKMHKTLYYKNIIKCGIYAERLAEEPYH